MATNGIQALEAAASSDLVDQGVEADHIRFERRARLRTPGSDTTIVVELGTADEMRSTFEALHRKRFGYIDEAEPILDTLTVDAIAGTILPSLPRGGGSAKRWRGKGAHLPLHFAERSPSPAGWGGHLSAPP